MDGTTSNPRYNRLHDISPSNVAGGIVVGISRIAAQTALKLRLTFSVGPFAMSTHRTGARRVASVNQTKRHAALDGAVFHKLSQLVEAPTAVLRPLRPSQPYPFADARKVFELQLASSAFGRFNEVLGNLVVGIAAESRLFPRDLLESALGRTGAALLQARTVALVLPAFVLDLSARKGFAVGGSSKLHYAEVNTQSALGFFWRFILKPALQMDVPLALSASDKLTPLNGESGAQKVPLIPADFEGDSQPAIHSRERDGFVGNLDAQDALVVVNRSSLKSTRPLAFALANSGYGPHRKVGAEAKLSPNILVGQLLQGELGEVLPFSGDLQNVVTRRRKPVDRPAQALGLTRLGYQLATHA